MRLRRSSLLLTSLLAMSACVLCQAASAQTVNDQIKTNPSDWPWWRGPARNGIAHSDQQPPREWGETQNIVWKTNIPGRGNGSPIVVGQNLYLATCDEDRGSQSVLCYDADTGKLRWQAEVHPSGAMRKNAKSTGASSTLACDGERLFINFANSGAAFVTALDLSGKQLWQRRLCDYVIHQGYGASPAIYQSLVLVIADSHAGGVLAGLDRQTGNVVWKHDRPKVPNYTSPILLNVAGKDQLFLTGCDLVSSFDPLTGKVLWEIEGATTECVTSTVTDGKHIFTSGGYPRNHTSAVAADGTGRIVWESNNRVYVPSLLAKDGYLYGVLDAGVAACWKSETGEEMWKARLGGDFSASPVLVGDTIYATSELGKTFVFRADPQQYQPLAENQLGTETFATPTICRSRIYLRVAHQTEGRRQELLYCVGESN